MSFFRTYKKSELKSVHGAEPGEQRWPFPLCQYDLRHLPLTI